MSKLTNIQHDYPSLIISRQHVSLDHDNCLKIIIAKGSGVEVQFLANKLKAATRGKIRAADDSDYRKK